MRVTKNLSAICEQIGQQRRGSRSCDQKLKRWSQKYTFLKLLIETYELFQPVVSLVSPVTRDVRGILVRILESSYLLARKFLSEFFQDIEIFAHTELIKTCR